MDKLSKKMLYETIMKSVAKEVKKYLNEHSIKDINNLLK